MVGETMPEVNFLRLTIISISLFLQGGWVPVQAESIHGKTFDNWTIRCEDRVNELDCHLFQNRVLPNGGSRVLHIAVGFPRNSDSPVILVSMPLGISLPPGATMVIDDHEPMRFQVERCEPSGCRGGFRLLPEVIEQLSEGERAIVTFFDARREPIEVPVNLGGFAEGLAALRE